MNNERRIEHLFELLTEWRTFPNYQLERRADIFFALYLKDILWHFYPNNEFDLIVPEFPLRYGSIAGEGLDRKRSDEARDKRTDNLSVKVDYLCLDRANNFCILLELKTEERSLRDEQFTYLERAVEAKYEKVLDGVRELLEHTKEKTKYRKLLDHMDAEVGQRYDAPLLSTDDGRRNETIMAIIKPTPDRTKCPAGCHVISFDDVIQALSKLTGPMDHLTKTFLEALAIWKEPLPR